MPRLNTSDTVKEQLSLLLRRLLTYVNGESVEQADWSDKIIYNWLKYDKPHPKLIVKTELKVLVDFCNAGTKKTSVISLTTIQMRNVLDVLKDWGILTDNRTNPQGSRQRHFTLNLWSSFTEENLWKFEEEWDKRKSPGLENSSIKTEINYGSSLLGMVR